MATKTLSNAEKAATILITLGEDLASEIMAKMSPTEIRRVASAIATLGRIPEAQATAVAAEFFDTLNNQKSGGIVGNAGLVANLFQRIGKGGEAIAQTLDLATPILTEALGDYTAPDLLVFLRPEQPQTMALVLAHCDAAKAATVLKGLPEIQRTEVMQRIATLGPVLPEILEELVDALRQAADRQRPLRGQAVGGAAKLAAMMARLAPEEQTRLLDELAARNPDLAAEVRRGMFTFADLRQIEPRGLQVLVSTVPAAVLRLALKGAAADVAEFFYANMSPRAAQMLREDIESMPKTRATEVTAAQQQVAETAQKLADEGKLRIIGVGEAYV